MTTNTTDTAPIICRSLRQVDALVAEHVTKIFPPNVLNRNLGIVPEYTTWAMLGEVVAKVEAAGYYWEVGGARHNHHAFLWGRGNMKNEQPEIVADHQSTAPVALCLAALAAFGCRVQLELGGE